VFTARALGSIRLEDVHSQGYGFQVDMLFHAQRAGLSIVEVPITFVERELGVSKMTGGIVAEAMLRVTLWGLGALPGRLRRRFAR
jgi:dolichol-phosphate mannosyltransferase